MFTEKGLEAHLYLWIAGIVFAILFIGYTFWFDHKSHIDENESWVSRFENEGLSREQINDLTHDDTMWYYQRKSTCVGYGEPNEACPKNENFCSGGSTYGDFSKQAEEIAMALKKGGVHPDCPLIYLGGD